MRWPRYESYRPSIAEGLGEVPAHWRTCPLRFAVSTPITDGPDETPEFVADGVPFISAEACGSGVINFSKQRGFITPEDDRRFARKYKPFIDRMDGNDEIFRRVMGDEQFRSVAARYLLERVYGQARK